MYFVSFSKKDEYYLLTLYFKLLCARLFNKIKSNIVTLNYCNDILNEIEAYRNKRDGKKNYSRLKFLEESIQQISKKLYPLVNN